MASAWPGRFYWYSFGWIQQGKAGAGRTHSVAPAGQFLSAATAISGRRLVEFDALLWKGLYRLVIFI